MALVTPVTAPARRPRSGGIKDVIDGYVTEERLAAVEGVEWEDAGCGFPRETFAACAGDLVPDKEYDGVETLEGIGKPFFLYAGVQCYLGGDNDGPSYAEQASAILAAGEDRAIEERLWAWALDATDTDTAATLVEAIAAAEKYADANYVAAPVLILSRDAATLAFAAGALEREDGKLVTANGVRVLATGVVADADAGTVGIIGQPAVYAGNDVVRQTPDTTLNTSMAIAERGYAVGVDCQFRYTVTTS